MRSVFIPTAGVRLHAWEAGEGPLVLMIHGHPGLGYSWRHQLPALAAAYRELKVKRPNLRGVFGAADARDVAARRVHGASHRSPRLAPPPTRAGRSPASTSTSLPTSPTRARSSVWCVDPRRPLDDHVGHRPRAVRLQAACTTLASSTLFGGARRQ